MPAGSVRSPESDAAADVSSIRLHGVTVRYGGVTALHPTDLAIAPGEIVVLLGPSGSGKTTLLRSIAGFVQPAAGRIMLSGRDVTGWPPHRRDLGMVVQSYALFPHLRIAANVGFGLRARRRPQRDIDHRVERCLAMVGMSGFGARYPRELSGGQQQRVAIARALAIEPTILLLDEPLSALDAPLRAEMLEQIRTVHAQLPGLSIVYVTHDQAEAIGLAHRIVMMRAGRIAAIGTPRSLHDSPPDCETARFFGDANLIAVTLRRRLHDGLIEADLAGRTILARAPAEAPAQPMLCIRPHDLHFCNADAAYTVPVNIGMVRWLGAVQRVTVWHGERAIRLDRPGGEPVPPPGSTAHIGFDPQCATILPAS